MKTSSPLTPLPRQPRNVLLIGPPGSGKTTLMLQFPGLRVLDCDQNLQGPEKWVRKLNPALTYGYDIVTRNDKGETVLDWECWDRLMSLMNDIIKNDKESKIIGTDGLTPINEFLIRKVLKEQGNKTLMEPHFWGPFKTRMLELMFGKLRTLGRDTILTCHETLVTKSKGGKDFMLEEVIARKPTVNGGIGDYFGGFFTDIWRLELRPKPEDKFEPWMRTVRTTTDDLKNSMFMPGEMVATWESIKPYWEGVK